MKSNVAIRSNTKLDTKEAIRRHKTSRSPSVKNGKVANSEGSSVNMVAAIQDHISCTKSADLLKIQDSKEDKVALACELDHMYANCGEPKLSTDDSQPMKQLKELLLFHLDLVQQQEEQLRAKDCQLNQLREEKQALKQRLEQRVENRKSQAKQKQKIVESSNLTNNSNSEVEIDSYVSPTTPSDETRQRLQPEKSRKRKGSSDLTHCRRNIRALSKSESADEETDLNSEIKQIESNESSEQTLNDTLTSSESRKDFLQSDSNYFSNYNPLRNPDSLTPHEEVLVPSWRLHLVTSSYQLERTENLADEVFVKRHQKFEVRERRRKKWDIQQLREQKKNEKLKRGRSGIIDDPDEDLDSCSFCPNPDEAQFLEVSDTVPVCAFGHPVPNFQPCEFSLPLSFTKDSEEVIENRCDTLRSSSSKLKTSDGKKGS